MNMDKIKNILILFLAFISMNVISCFGADNTQNDSAKINEVKMKLKTIYNTNNLEDAYKIVSTITENERDSEIWYLLANITQDLNEEDDAMFYLQKAILMDKTNDKAYYNLGNIYQNKGQVYNAIKMYKEAIKLKNDFAPYHYNLGCAYLKAEDVKSAKSQFSKAVTIQPNEPNYRFNLALAYKMLGNTKKAQQELDVYNKLTQE